MSIARPLLLSSSAAAVIAALTLPAPPILALLAGAVASAAGWRAGWTPTVAKHCLVAIVFVIGCRLDLGALRLIGWDFVFITGLAIAMTLVLGKLASSFVLTGRYSLLISVGTAICGGSAIATIAPIVRARAADIAVAMSVVFACNAAALASLPVLGATLNLDPDQFGLWCALAVHETGSVVSAASEFGPESAQVATLGKLIRTLWILPVAILVTLRRSKNQGSSAVLRVLRSPVLVAFGSAVLLSALIPSMRAWNDEFTLLSRHGIKVVMVLTGLGVTWAQLKTTGVRPFLVGFGLWVVLASSTLSLMLLGQD